MTDHSSYLSRHRPICTVIEEIRERLKKANNKIVDYEVESEIDAIIKLCDEAKDYAQRMSNRLMEYKRREYGIMYGMKETEDGSQSESAKGSVSSTSDGH